MHKSSCFATLTYNDEHLDKINPLTKGISLVYETVAK